MKPDAWEQVPRDTRSPDFGNLLAVLRRETPSRPTLFEFFLNDPLYERLAGEIPACDEDLVRPVNMILGCRNAGYDYAFIPIPNFTFAAGEHASKSTRSLNEGAVISDRASFDAYEWPDPEQAEVDILDRLQPFVPDGMKLIINSPHGGVLENAIKLVGYEALCYMLIDTPDLARAVFDEVGSRLVRLYERAAPHPIVGAVIGNDDWGFKSQPMLSPDQMREFVVPWHRKIAAVAHATGKPAILHSCGNLVSLMDDIIDDIGYDGKHSYEDTIMPVEKAWDRYHDRIAILGGIDVDFVIRSSCEAVYERSRKMVDKTGGTAWALGTGNSVPEYVPDEKYFAMIRAIIDER